MVEKVSIVSFYKHKFPSKILPFSALAISFDFPEKNLRPRVSFSSGAGTFNSAMPFAEFERVYHKMSCENVCWNVAVFCNMLQRFAVSCNVLQCLAICCSVLQCVAVYCSVL